MALCFPSSSVADDVQVSKVKYFFWFWFWCVFARVPPRVSDLPLSWAESSAGTSRLNYLKKRDDITSNFSSSHTLKVYIKKQLNCTASVAFSWLAYICSLLLLPLSDSSLLLWCRLLFIIAICHLSDERNKTKCLGSAFMINCAHTRPLTLYTSRRWSSSLLSIFLKTGVRVPGSLAPRTLRPPPSPRRISINQPTHFLFTSTMCAKPRPHCAYGTVKTQRWTYIARCREFCEHACPHQHRKQQCNTKTLTTCV